MRTRISTGKAAAKVGISRDTLHRWLRTPKIAAAIKAPKPVLRNGRGVRLWSESDLERLKRIKTKIYWKGRGGKKAARS